MRLFYLNIMLLMVLVFGLTSCTKFGKNFAIEGKVLNPITGEPYEGIQVRLFKKVLSDGSYWGGGSKTIKNTYTDANGHFKLNAGRLSQVLVMIEDTKDNYTLGWHKKNGETIDAGYLELPRGKTAHWDYYMVPYGKLNLDIKNVNCEGVSDTMRLRNKWEFDEDGYGSWSPLYYTGCYQKITGASKVPEGKHTYQIEVKRTNMDTIIEFSGIVHKGQLTTIEIKY